MKWLNDDDDCDGDSESSHEQVWRELFDIDDDDDDCDGDGEGPNDQVRLEAPLHDGADFEAQFEELDKEW